MNPQANKIYEILKDGVWHCPIEWNYADGHCKRITDINNYGKTQGFKVISEVCDCGRHTSKIFKRKLVSEPSQTSDFNMKQSIAKVKIWADQFVPTPDKKGFCCYSFPKFRVHAKDCQVEIKEVKENALW